MTFKFFEAWKLGRDNIKIAQKCQKKQYDHKKRLSKFEVGDQCYICMLAAKAFTAYKFARPFHGPYHIVGQSETEVAYVQLIHHKHMLLA